MFQPDDWYYWINWLPGVIYGFVIGRIHFREKNQVTLFSLSSGTLFLIANVVVSFMRSDSIMRSVLVWGFIVGGLLGALVLLVMGKFLTRSKVTIEVVILTLVNPLFPALPLA